MRFTIATCVLLSSLLAGFWLMGAHAASNASTGQTIECIDGTAIAVPSPFSYQGRLMEQEGPAQGRFQFAFALYDQVVGGAQLNENFLWFTLDVNDGFFHAQLPFASALFDGGPRFLEIRVRPADSGQAYITLTPRQQITASPYSIHAAFAAQAGDAARLGGREPASYADKVHSHSALAAPDGSNTNLIQAIDSNTVNLNGLLRINNLPAARILRFRNIGHETNLNTGVPAADYECVPTGWSTKYDVYESRPDTYMVWTFVHQTTWYVTVKFGSEADDEDPDVDILCLHKGLVSWEAGTPDVERSLWEPD